MKQFILTLLLPSLLLASEFNFKYVDGSKIKVQAKNWEAAYKIAAKQCFQELTKGKYPGEERGLYIIDICANPRGK